MEEVLEKIEYFPFQTMKGVDFLCVTPRFRKYRKIKKILTDSLLQKAKISQLITVFHNFKFIGQTLAYLQCFNIFPFYLSVGLITRLVNGLRNKRR